MPTPSAPEIRPEIRNDQSPSFTGDPNDGARPPGAGGTGGASGDIPRPGGRGEPGIVSGGAGSSAFAPREPIASARSNEPAMRRLAASKCNGMLALASRGTDPPGEERAR